MTAAAPVRFVIATPVAAFVAAALFILMRALIFVDGEPPSDAGDDVVIDIVSQKTDTDVRLREARPDQPDEIKAPPPPPRIEAAKAEAPKEGLASVLGRLPDLQVDALGKNDVSFTVADRDEQPLVRGEQRYPRRALERGLEGTCTMGFDLNPDGTTTNISVISCTNQVFGREGVRAVERYKYAPKIIDGEAVVRRGLQIELVWQLAE